MACLDSLSGFVGLKGLGGRVEAVRKQGLDVGFRLRHHASMLPSLHSCCVSMVFLLETV